MGEAGDDDLRRFHIVITRADQLAGGEGVRRVSECVCVRVSGCVCVCLNVCVYVCLTVCV